MIFFTSTLKACFEAFYQRMDRYDSLLCVNDFVAVYFLRELRRRGHRIPERMRVISFIDTQLGRAFAPSLTAIYADSREFGRQAACLHAYLQKHSGSFPLTVYVDCHSIGAGLPAPSRTEENAQAPSESPLYQDADIRRMQAIETLLVRCDETDLRILKGLLRGQYYTAIALECFVSEPTVKRRIKEMAGLLGVASRKELTARLEEYLGPDTL